ncbi:MAG: hypothetical protein OTI35_06630 [Sulfitobacter sp.]|nr:hypothetical protein [Sulfitobacter sp.]
MTGNPITSPPSSWKDSLQSGNIVAYRFPHQRKGAQQPKVRPALVIDVVEKEGERFAVLAYGTSNPRLRKDAYTVDVEVPDELNQASLHKPTRFHISRRVEVSLEDRAFDLKSSAMTPVLGRLTGRSKCRLNDVNALINSVSKAGRRGLFGRRQSQHVSKSAPADYVHKNHKMKLEPHHV